MKKVLSILLLSAALLYLQPAQAWGPTGHRVVAEIASFRLSNKAKLAIQKIIGNESLAMIANWPDFIKSDTTGEYNHTSPWHYLDFPGHCTRADFDRIMSEAKGENLYSQTVAMIAQLKTPNPPLSRNALRLPSWYT